MQKLTEIQMKFRENPISGIISDNCTRSGISGLLMGLQCAYLSPEMRGKIFDLMGNGGEVGNGYTETIQKSELTVSVFEDEYGVILDHHF